MMEYEAVARWVHSQQAEHYLIQMQAMQDELIARPSTANTGPASSVHDNLSTTVRDMLLGDVFAAFDVDGDGFVDAGELMQLGAARQQLKQEGRKWTAAKNRALVEMLDTNKDGRVSRDEFVRGFGDATPVDYKDFGALM